jgi:SAM-dependent methyltransferase
MHAPAACPIGMSGSRWSAEAGSYVDVKLVTNDPLAGSAWSRPETVAGFVHSAPNAALLQCGERERARGARRLLDIGCGAGRNAVPLAQAGWQVVGVDLSWPMIAAASRRNADEAGGARVHLAMSAMHDLPFADRSFDLVVAHGIWNLARSSAAFRRSVAEAARVARAGAALFVFTFSRTTLPPDVEPLPGEPFVFTQFSGQPQCFLTAGQLSQELGAAGFVPDQRIPLRELNVPPPGVVYTGPAIWEGVFRRTG